jgi:hypothetical protein
MSSLDSEINNADCEDNGSPRHRSRRSNQQASAAQQHHANGLMIGQQGSLTSGNNQRYIGFGPQVDVHSIEKALRSSAGDTTDENTLAEFGENDVLISIIKGGRRQYVRKVDYLVDELIRKKAHHTATYRGGTRMSLSAGDEFDDSVETMSIPSFVGPGPRDDQRLSLILPPPISSALNNIISANGNGSPSKRVNSPNSPSKANSNSNSRSPHSPSGSSKYNNRFPNQNQTQLNRTAYYSGDRTHTDWEMEEVDPVVSSLPSSAVSAQTTSSNGVGSVSTGSRFSNQQRQLATMQSLSGLRRVHSNGDHGEHEDGGDGSSLPNTDDSDMACCDDWSGSRRCSDVTDDLEEEEEVYEGMSGVSSFYPSQQEQSKYEGDMMAMDQGQDDSNNGIEMSETLPNFSQPQQEQNYGYNQTMHNTSNSFPSFQNQQQQSPLAPLSLGSSSSYFFGFNTASPKDGNGNKTLPPFAANHGQQQQQQHLHSHASHHMIAQDSNHNSHNHSHNGLQYHRLQQHHFNNGVTGGIHYSQSFLNLSNGGDNGTACNNNAATSMEDAATIQATINNGSYGFAKHSNNNSNGVSHGSFLMRQSFYGSSTTAAAGHQQPSPTTTTTGSSAADLAWSQLATKHWGSHSNNNSVNVSNTSNNKQQQRSSGEDGDYFIGYANEGDDDEDVVHVGTFG